MGTIASAFGGKAVTLSHQGQVFLLTPESMKRWKGWRNVTLRDQLGVWVVGCMLGMGIPTLISLQFVAGREVSSDRLATMTAQGVIDATGARVFWFLTLLCGYMVLGPSQIGAVDTFCRRRTDVIWSASPRVKHLRGDKVKYIYSPLMTVYAVWGCIVLILILDPLMVVKVSGVPMTFTLEISAIHTLVINCVFQTGPLRPGWFMRLCMLACSLFFASIAITATTGLLRGLGFVGGPVS